MAKIKSIQCVTDIEVGYTVGKGGVVKIQDDSIEFPDSLHNMYSILGENDQLIARLEYCPVVIKYDTEN